MTLPWSSSSYFPEVFIRLTVPVHFAEVEQTSGHNYPPLGGLWLLPAVFHIPPGTGSRLCPNPESEAILSQWIY